MNEEQLLEHRRKSMVEEQILARGVRTPRLLEVLKQVPRHRFVTTEYSDLAYADRPLPIGEGQTISQPYIVALMTDLLQLQGDETVLEIGTGSGYQAAILAHMAREVHTVERIPSLAARAVSTFKELGLDNICTHVGDGSMGLPEFAPYHAVIVTAAAPEVPKPLLEQLAPGGRLVIPVGARFNQDLEVWQNAPGGPSRKFVEVVAFVPLRGQLGWRDKGEDW